MLPSSCGNPRGNMFGTFPLSRGGGPCEDRPMHSDCGHTFGSSLSTYSKNRKLNLNLPYLGIVLSMCVRALCDFHDLGDTKLVLHK